MKWQHSGLSPPFICRQIPGTAGFFTALPCHCTLSLNQRHPRRGGRADCESGTRNQLCSTEILGVLPLSSEWKASRSGRLRSGCLFPCIPLHCQLSVCQDQGHGWRLERLSVEHMSLLQPACVSELFVPCGDLLPWELGSAAMDFTFLCTWSGCSSSGGVKGWNKNTQLGQISVLFHRSGARIYLQVPRVRVCVCVGLRGGFQYQVFPRAGLWLACNLHCISIHS